MSAAGKKAQRWELFEIHPAYFQNCPPYTEGSNSFPKSEAVKNTNTLGQRHLFGSSEPSQTLLLFASSLLSILTAVTLILNLKEISTIESKSIQPLQTMASGESPHTEASFSKLALVLQFLIDEIGKHSRALEKNQQQVIYSNGISGELNLENDLPVVLVNVDKANLRAGPGIKHSPLMAISGGTRLAVLENTGDWLKVVSPNGTPVWIQSQLVVSSKN